MTAGDKLGPYEILEPIGKGGMGEVYRAHDSRLGRDVAVNVSAEQFGERFQREARAVASLNHPNVCTLFDVGPNYLVMELIEGPTLADRIKEGAIPLEESLAIARQIADALEAAHEKGITHRDLKPGNVKVRPDGTVKVLDFGLAKVAPAVGQAPRPDTNAEESPTISMAATQAGVILGTAAYMAPEQARGKAVDKRADIWAFGVVLYEVVTGQRLFRGEDLTDTLAAVVRDKADVSAAPPRLRHLLEACLQKDPKHRLRDIADVRFLLEQPAGQPALVPQPPASRLSWIPWATAAVAILAAAALGFGYYRATRPEPLKPMVRLDVDLGADVALATFNGSSNVIISPDGTRLAYIASVAGGTPSLFIRRFDQARAVELPGTPNPVSPFFSPDGQWVGFTANGRLGKISVEGGAVVPLRGDVAANITGASWGEDGNIVHGLLLSGLFSISDAGGDPSLLLAMAEGEVALQAPQILPGGKAVLFAADSASLDPDDATIEVLSLPDLRRKTVVRGGLSARYLAASDGAGYLLYANRATLFAVPFDLDNMETRGTALPVLDDVAYNPATFESQFSVSRDGTLVYRKSGGAAADQTMTIQWLDAAGNRQPLVTLPAGYQGAHLSPDGRRLAAAVGVIGDQGVQVYDLQRETWSRLTFDSGIRSNPIWSPDGRHIVFGSLNGLQWTRADGSGQPQPLTPPQNIQVPGSFSPDGKRVAYFQIGGQSNAVMQIWTVPVEEDGAGLKADTPEQFVQSPLPGQLPAFSPDGKWLAYQSGAQGSFDVYVRAFPDNGGLWKISTNGGINPVWSRSAPELLYQAGNQIMAVRYSVNGDAFVPEKSRVWAAQAGGQFQDLSADGKRALILSPVSVDTPETPTAEHEVVLIQNFVDELQRRVPLSSN